MLRPLGSGRRRSLARGARWLLGRGTRSDGDPATAIPHDFSAPGVWDANTRVHTEGTRLLLEASLSAGVGTYLQQSITLAYPDRGDQWLDEDTPLDDSPERAEVVIPVRFMSAQVRSVDPARLRWCVLRGGMLVGPGTAQEATVARLQAGEGRVMGDGGGFLSLVHVDDFVAAVTDAPDCAPSGSVFNMVDEPMKQGEYLEHLAHIIGAESPQDIPSGNVPPSQRCSNCRASARCLDGGRRAASGQMPLPARVRRTLQNPAQVTSGERPFHTFPG